MHKMGIRGPWQENPVSKTAHLSLVHFLESPEKGKRAIIKHIESYNLWAVSAWYPHFCNLKKKHTSKLFTPRLISLAQANKGYPSPLLSWHVCAGHTMAPTASSQAVNCSCRLAYLLLSLWMLLSKVYWNLLESFHRFQWALGQFNISKPDAGMDA